MADIAASDVTYTLQEGTQYSSPADPRNCGVYKVEFGDSSLTYPSGGVPLTKAKLGCPAEIISLEILDQGDADGLLYKYDRENEKIRIYNMTAGHTHDVKIIGGTAAAGTDTLNVKSLVIGKEEATSVTVLGADSATKGGVVASSASAGAEFSGAVTAVDLYVKVVGW